MEELNRMQTYEQDYKDGSEATYVGKRIEIAKGLISVDDDLFDEFDKEILNLFEV